MTGRDAPAVAISGCAARVLLTVAFATARQGSKVLSVESVGLLSAWLVWRSCYELVAKGLICGQMNLNHRHLDNEKQGKLLSGSHS